MTLLTRLLKDELAAQARTSGKAAPQEEPIDFTDLQIEEEDLNAQLATLNDGQQAAFKLLVRLVSNETNGPVVVLKGYAGTGKTYLVGKFIQWLVFTLKQQVLVTAPTNKAVKVLRNASPFGEGGAVRFCTIHSALGLKENIDYNGKVTFQPDRFAEVPISSYKLLLVDEVSMLGDDLFKEIELHTQRGLLVILIGDPRQIPPVGQRDTVAFSADRKQELGIETAELTQIVRQSAGNPIIQLTQAVRDRINYKGTYNEIYAGEVLDSPEGPLGVRYVSLSSEPDQEYLEALIGELFTGEAFQLDADHAKIIAWRNNTVDTFNSLVRSLLYGEEARKLEIGDKLIADKPIIQHERTVFATNAEFVVVGYDVKKMRVGLRELEYYDAEVEALGDDGEAYRVRIPIIHENGEEAFKEAAEERKKHALSQPPKSSNAKQAWISYYRFFETFAAVKYNYAITAHKSQGSTYQNVIVAEYDINANITVQERNRIKYTAFSRAAKYLAVLID